MALYFTNASGVTAWVALVWKLANTTGCGPWSEYVKTGWWEVKDGQTANIWNVDLQQHADPIGAFFAEEYINGQGLTWGDLGVRNTIAVQPPGFNQCYGDQEGCTQLSKFAQLAFNTAANTQIRLLPHVAGEVTWEEFVFD